MAQLGSRRGAANPTVLLMVLAFALIAGFLYWLHLTAEPTRVEAVEEVAEDGGVRTVTLAELGGDPATLLGETIRVRDVAVASRLGTQAFWTELPNQTPFLIRLGPELVAQGATVAPNQRYTVVGSVHAMSDSVLDAWQEAQAFTDEVQRIEAEFATSFLEVAEIQPRGGDGGDS